MTDPSDHVPRWERRLRAPQIPPWTLLGKSATWPRDADDRVVVMANLAGRIEAYVIEPNEQPAPLRQITDREQGTLGVAMSPDGRALLWFDDTAGDEVGRWVNQPLDGAAATVLAADLEPGFMAGVAPLSDGGAVVCYLGDGGMRLVLVAGDGSGREISTSSDGGEVTATDPDETVALVAVAREGDWQHPGLGSCGSATDVSPTSCSNLVVP